MEYEVEVVCTATAGRLMKKGVAETLVVKAGFAEDRLRLHQGCARAGVKFFCCSPNLDLFDMTEDDLIPECEGVVGALT